MRNNGAPKIKPVNVAGGAGGFMLEFQCVADVSPQQFPLGLDLVLCRPGELAPLGNALIPQGWMLVAFPPHVADHLRLMVLQAAAQERQGLREPGQVKAPGVGG